MLKSLPRNPEETQEATEEVVEEQATETVAETEEPPVEEEAQSSLESEQPESQETAQEAQQEEEIVELTDDVVFEYLSEMLGKDIKSADDLVQQAADPLENDPDLKEIVEWRKRTGRPLSDFAKYQKDYSAMSSEEVVKEYLQHKYPDFTAEEIQLEMEQYLPSEDDLDNEAARKRLNLKKLAADGRRELDSHRLELDKPLPASLTQEQAEAVEFYQQYQQGQEKAKKVQQVNSQNIAKAVKEVETLKLQLDKDTSIQFKPPQESRNSVQEFMKMPNWYNQDGTINGQEIIKDSFKLQNFDAIVSEAYQQGLARGQASIEKTTNNTTLSEDRPTQEGQNPSKQDIKIEGLEGFQKWTPKWGR